jgi:hypothetical protein
MLAVLLYFEVLLPSLWSKYASLLAWIVVMKFSSLLRLKLVQLLKHLKDSDILRLQRERWHSHQWSHHNVSSRSMCEGVMPLSYSSSWGIRVHRSSSLSHGHDPRYLPSLPYAICIPFFMHPFILQKSCFSYIHFSENLIMNYKMHWNVLFFLKLYRYFLFLWLPDRPVNCCQTFINNCLTFDNCYQENENTLWLYMYYDSTHFICFKPNHYGPPKIHF